MLLLDSTFSVVNVTITNTQGGVCALAFSAPGVPICGEASALNKAFAWWGDQKNAVLPTPNGVAKAGCGPKAVTYDPSLSC